MDKRQSNDKAEAAAQVGALISALLASACCWLPLLLIAFGASGGALSARFEAMRPVLLPVTFALLGSAFYFTYRKPRAGKNASNVNGETCREVPGAEPGAEFCCTPASAKGLTLRKLHKPTLWVVTLFVLAFSFFPNYAGFFIRGGEASSANPAANRVEWTMTIDGMTCPACAAHLESALLKVPGVTQAAVHYEQSRALVAAAIGVSESDLRSAVKVAGYSISSIHKTIKSQRGIQ